MYVYLTLFIYLLFCRWVVSVELLLHPRGARLRLAVIDVAPAPGRTVHVLVMHRKSLIAHHKLIFKVVVVLQVQNILHRKRRRARRTGMHPQVGCAPIWILFDALCSSCWWRCRTPLLTDWWVRAWRLKSFKSPAKERGRDISVTPLLNTGQHPHNRFSSHLTQEHLTPYIHPALWGSN